jgi:hypothetical protein
VEATGKLIMFECVAAAHQPATDRPDKLTVHQNAWAFCAFDARADGHEWHEIAGRDLPTMMRRSGFGLGREREAARTGGSRRGSLSVP